MEHGAVSFKNFSLDVEAGTQSATEQQKLKLKIKMHIAAVAAVNQKC